jgi:alpha-beta hydrolase superfamily lysophospholipase
MEREISFNSSGNLIKGRIFVPQGLSGEVPAVIVSHGAFEFKERYYELCRSLAVDGIASLIMDMNGHGESEGKRFEIDLNRWIADIKSGVDFLVSQPEVNPDCIAVFGLSTGGTVALEAAMKDLRIGALILFAPTVRNIMTLYEIIMYCLIAPVGFVKAIIQGEPLKVPMLKALGGKKLVRDEEVNKLIIDDPRFRESYVPIPGSWQASMVDTIERAGNVTIPTLILHGENDELDSPETSRLLFERMNCKKKLIIMPETGHAGHLDRHRNLMYKYTAQWVLENLEAAQ